MKDNLTCESPIEERFLEWVRPKLLPGVALMTQRPIPLDFECLQLGSCSLKHRDVQPILRCRVPRSDNGKCFDMDTCGVIGVTEDATAAIVELKSPYWHRRKYTGRRIWQLGDYLSFQAHRASEGKPLPRMAREFVGMFAAHAK